MRILKSTRGHTANFTIRKKFSFTLTSFATQTADRDSVELRFVMGIRSLGNRVIKQLGDEGGGGHDLQSLAAKFREQFQACGIDVIDVLEIQPHRGQRRAPRKECL